MKPPSPETLAIASLWALLLDAAVIAVLAFAYVDRFAPVQDLPWKPLSLNDPLGRASLVKFARVVADPAQCRAVLREGGVAFEEEPLRTDGFCSTADAISITGGVTPLSPAAPTMTCAAAVSLALWDRQVLQPASEIVLGSKASRIDHYGTYACRRVYGRETGRVSEHALANAFDFAGVRLADGRRITVASDFRDEADEGVFMRAIRTGACGIFQGVLSPDYNAAHADHLHLDRGPFRLCR